MQLRSRLCNPTLVLIFAMLAAACAPAPVAAPTPVAAPAQKPGPGGTPAAPTAAPAPAQKPAAVAPTAVPQPTVAPTVAPKPAAPAKPATLEKVGFRGSFGVSGLDVPWFLALEKGFYAEQGLDVEILDGTGSQASAQQVGTGALAFGFSDANVIVPGIFQGIPVVSISGLIQKHPNAVIYREDSGIKTPKDLEGRQVGMNTSGATSLLFPAFLKGAKVDAGKVSVVNLSANVMMPSLFDNKVPAVATWWITQGTLANMSGVKAKWFIFADYMENAYSSMLITNTKIAKERPDLVRRFLAATHKAIEYGEAHPEEGAAAVVKHRPALKRDITLAQWKALPQTFYTERTRGKGIGWQSEEDWQRTISQLKDIGALKGELKASQVYTNDFLPK